MEHLEIDEETQLSRINKKQKNKLIEALKKEIIRQYGSNYLASPNYGKIIDYEHFRRVISLLDEQK